MNPLPALFAVPLTPVNSAPKTELLPRHCRQGKLHLDMPGVRLNRRADSHGRT